MSHPDARLVADFVAVVESLVVGRSALTRDQAIIAGHLVRIVKIGRRMLRDLADDDGDQQFPLTRQYLDSYSSLVYLLDPAPDDGTRFDQYLKDSLVAELDLLRAAESEPRLLAELDRALTTAGMTPDDVPGRRKIGWPSAEVRMRAVGDGAYVAYRSGSNAVHGTWIDLLRAHLTVTENNDDNGAVFAPRLEPEAFRPEVLRRFVVLGVAVIRLATDDVATRTALDELAARTGVA